MYVNREVEINMIYYAKQDWIPTGKNPFSEDGEYSYKWSAVIFEENTKYYAKIEENAKLFTVIISSKLDVDYERINDFINYESKYNRNVIIKSDKSIKRKLESNKNKIRERDPRWLVHSTTEEAYKLIKESNFLYSPKELRKLGKEISEIGLKHYLEPKDYSDYIMLDILNGCGELVVNSRQLGYVCTDGNMEYNPGVRLYFDAHKIIEDGLAERDGLHILKVEKELSLDKYLVMAVTKDKAKEKVSWTPTTYTEWANNYFLRENNKK